MTIAERRSKARADSLHGIRSTLFRNQSGVLNGAHSTQYTGLDLAELKNSLIRNGLITPALNTINQELSSQYAAPRESPSGLSFLIEKLKPDYRGYTGTASILNGIFKPSMDRSLRKQMLKDDIMEYISAFK